MDCVALIAQLEKLETGILASLQDVRSVKTELLKESSKVQALEPLLDAEALAKILGVDTAYVYSQARARQIPSVRLGKYRRFTPNSIKKWLDRKGG